MRKFRFFGIVTILGLGLALTAHGQVPTTGAGPGARPASGGITYTVTDVQNDAPAYAAHNYTINIGAASADRIVIVGFITNAINSIPAPTINSSSMTYCIGVGQTNANQQAIYYANVATGTTATLGMPDGAAADAVVVSTLHGQSGGGSAPCTNATTYNTSQAQPIGPMSLTVSAGGIGFLVCGGSFANDDGDTYTWVNTTSSSGDAATSIAASGGGVQIGTSHITATASVSCSSSESLSFVGTLIGASWAP